MLYEQSYRGFDDAHSHEWEPAAVGVRRRLETTFERVLRRDTGARLVTPTSKPRPRAAGTSSTPIR
jgi:hypothetical protein